MCPHVVRTTLTRPLFISWRLTSHLKYSPYGSNGKQPNFSKTTADRSNIFTVCFGGPNIAILYPAAVPCPQNKLSTRTFGMIFFEKIIFSTGTIHKCKLQVPGFWVKEGLSIWVFVFRALTSQNTRKLALPGLESWIWNHVQGWTIRSFQGLVNFVPSVAYSFYLNLPAAFLQPGNSLRV